MALKHKKRRPFPDTRYHIRGLSAFNAIRTEIHERYNVSTCFLGYRRVEGKLTRQMSLVCSVTRKRKLDKQDPERIRKMLYYVHDGCRHGIKTDVIEIRKPLHYHAEYNPGDGINSGTVSATVGAFAKHRKYGAVFVTAGHFAEDVGGNGVQVHFTDAETGDHELAGRVITHEKKGAIDYALIKPHPDHDEQLSNFPITRIYQPTLKSDLGQQVFMVTRGKFKPTVCRAVGGSIGPPYSDEIIDNVILTDPVSKPGDSGCALVDGHMRVWGILLGSLPNNFSIFMPITTLLSRQSLEIGVHQ